MKETSSHFIPIKKTHRLMDAMSLIMTHLSRSDSHAIEIEILAMSDVKLNCRSDRS